MKEKLSLEKKEQVSGEIIKNLENLIDNYIEEPRFLSEEERKFIEEKMARGEATTEEKALYERYHKSKFRPNWATNIMGRLHIYARYLHPDEKLKQELIKLQKEWLEINQEYGGRPEYVEMIKKGPKNEKGEYEGISHIEKLENLAKEVIDNLKQSDKFIFTK